MCCPARSLPVGTFTLRIAGSPTMKGQDRAGAAHLCFPWRRAISTSG